MCNCINQPPAVDITRNYSDFQTLLKEVAVGDWVKLMVCGECRQLWRIDEWDRYQTLYAIKVMSMDGWKINTDNIIKEKMVNERGGLADEKCLMAGCDQSQVKGSLFCVNHLFDTGARK